MALTKKQKKEYLEAPHTCPYCGSVDLTGELRSEMIAEQVIICESCGKRWIDVYKLVDIEEI